MNTPFDNIFDYDRDGRLDCFEKGARDAFIMNMIGGSMDDGERDCEYGCFRDEESDDE